MRVFDERIYEIAGKAMKGNGLTELEACELYAVSERSKEASYIRRAVKSCPYKRWAALPKSTRRSG